MLAAPKQTTSPLAATWLSGGRFSPCGRTPPVGRAGYRAESSRVLSARLKDRAFLGTAVAFKTKARHSVHARGEFAGAYAVLAQPPSQPWQFDPLRLFRSADSEALARTRWASASPRGRGNPAGNENSNDFESFFKSDVPNKILTLLLLLLFSRVGVYIPLPGLDREAFQATMSQGGLLGYIDALAGGGISRLGIFSLGIVPFINSSIVFQLAGTLFPSLKKLQKEEGEAGRRKYMQYQRYGAVGFALAQAVGQTLYVRPFVYDFTPGFLVSNVLALTCGSIILMYIGERISDLKLGNGTSLLIFTNIVSALPTSVGATLQQAAEQETSGALPVFFASFLTLTMGIVYVQEAERKIPINYASRYSASDRGLDSSSYLPFKVNSNGVMPVIFATSLLAVPGSLARLTGFQALNNVASVIVPGGPLYLPVNVALIAFFNYFYTFLQLDPKDVSDQLKRQGASIPSVRPGKATSEYITGILSRMSLLGSVFLGILAVAPALVEGFTNLNAFRGFGGTSILILVGVATDTARRVQSDVQMSKYKQNDPEMMDIY